MVNIFDYKREWDCVIVVIVVIVVIYNLFHCRDNVNASQASPQTRNLLRLLDLDEAMTRHRNLFGETTGFLTRQGHDDDRVMMNVVVVECSAFRLNVYVSLSANKEGQRLHHYDTVRSFEMNVVGGRHEPLL